MRVLVKEITTTGSAGSATGTATTYLNGARLVGVGVDYAAGQPATADLTITNDGRTILTLANTSTDVVVLPRVPVQDAVGANISGRGEEPPLLDGTVTIALAQANAAAPAATVKLYLS